MTAPHRFMKFWPQDWQRDPALRMCSLEARGLWIELMCLAHDAEPYGHVMVSNRGATIDEIGVNARCNPRRVPKLLAELEAKGVFSRTPDGIIFSRRMVKDREVSQEGRGHVARRWGNRTGGNSGAISETTPNSPPNTQESESESDSSTAPHNAAGKTARMGMRGRRLPQDWQPSDNDQNYALERGLDPARVAEDFRGYWLAKTGAGAAKAGERGWSLTWQGWCRREAERRGKMPGIGESKPRFL